MPAPHADESLITQTHLQAFRGDLLAWYEKVKRPLPWRETRDPYRIWLSEIMLQQTRVEQAKPYYERFLEAFSTVTDLAKASLDEVLLRWEGLGYYARARNMHRAAQVVASDFDGVFPSDYETIRTLPGVGSYTAAAVLSIAFDQPHAAVDGNVIRVLSRVFALEQEVGSGSARRRLQQWADALLDPTRPGIFNEAMMELGATVCTPITPQCGGCPLQRICLAYQQKRPEAFPIKAKKKPVPHFDIAVGLIFDEQGRVLIQRRAEEGLLGGLWEFPGGKRQEDEALPEACRREIREELGVEGEVVELFDKVNHAYTHFKITMYAFLCRIAAGTPRSQSDLPLQWVTTEALTEYAFPRANRRLIDALTRGRQLSIFSKT